MHLSHREYYRDRLTEYELCQDFPADEILIDGLYSMQAHFDRNGVNIAIPIVRVMNTAHWLAAYMFATECSGDQMEYEVMASMSCGRDKQLAKVAMIVLAAMLKRTDGFRAKQCRNVILDNRPPDFEEGVTLYDRFLRSAEKHFAEEDFLIDTHAQIQQLQEENTRLTSENIKLKYTITTMEEKYQQINIGTQNINYGTVNNYYGYSPTSSTVSQNDSPSVSSETIVPPEGKELNSDIPDSIIFTKKAKKEGMIKTIIQAFKTALSSRRDKSRALAQQVQIWQDDEYLDAHYNAQVMYDEIAKIIPLPFGYEAFKQHYNHTRK